FATSQPVQAAEFSSCWVTTSIHPIYGTEQQITRCRIAGGTTVDYASDNDVPATLYPATGTDLTGQCWYYTSAVTRYVILARYANGDADIGFDTDPGAPGGIVAIGPTMPRCTSEPTPADDPLADVWEYVMQYIHDPPIPDLSPPPGDGVTGLETYIGVPVPDVHRAGLSSGFTNLEVFIEVSQVVVDWGDDMSDSYPPDREFLAGYPDGSATHMYETKSEDGVAISVSYDWTARWRIVGGAWDFLAVPNTTTTVVYPLAEIVSDLTD
ncbi:MAG: hypothetical protein R3324_09560, partial [Halobacteriales archaeon]|nr:hypothetical protein [Halobacteriales archaeon]